MKQDSRELKYAQKVQIHNYYVSLKQFFEITGGSHDRSMTARAQKARSKLLKLSSSQFFELSTDVNDELQRRIDESQPRHEFLIPNETFHAKRNQARQKLANLSNVRFNDLVDDILFEIQRRGFDALPDPSEADVHETSIDDEKLPPTTPALDVFDFKHSPMLAQSKTLEVEPELNEDHQAQNTTLQSSTVIPKKASIDWSSEEEDGTENLHHDQLETPVLNDVIKVARASSLNDSPKESIGMPPSYARNPVSIDNKFTSTENRPLSQSSDLNAEPEQTAPLSGTTASAGNMSPLTGTTNRFDSLSRSAERNKDRDIELLVSEGNKLDNTITNLEKEKSELLAELSTIRQQNAKLKEDNNAYLDQLAALRDKKSEQETTRALDNNFQRGMSEMTSQLNLLSIENEQLKQQKLELELQMKNAQSPARLHDQSSNDDASYSKRKYDQLSNLNRGLKKGSRNDLAPITDKSLFPIEGVIPSSLIDALDEKVVDLLNKVSSSAEQPAAGLFKAMATVSEYCSKILSLAHSPETNTMKLILENTISHAITSMRYFCSYKTPLLRVILENSITEISFAIYDLVKTINCYTTESDSMSTHPRTESKMEYSKQNTPILQHFADTSNEDYGLERPSFISSEQDPSEMSPVKPLKITQKKSSDDQTPNRPVSNRKPSGPGLFTAMLNGGLKKENGNKNSKNKLSLELPIDKSDEANNKVPQKKFDTSKEIAPVEQDVSSKTEVIDGSPLAAKSTGAVLPISNESRHLDTSTPERATRVQNLNSDMYNDSNEEDTSPESLDDDDDGNSTYEVLKQTMKQKHTQEEEDISDDTKQTRNIFSPVVHPQPIEVDMSPDDDALSDKPFNFESEDRFRSDPESAQSFDNNPQQVLKNTTIVKEPSSINHTPDMKMSPAPELVISPLKPVNRESVLFDNIKAAQEEKKSGSLDQKVNESESIPESAELGESDDDIEFDVDAFDIENPDNSLTDLLLYLEYQTMDVINTIQSLLNSIKQPKSTSGELRTESNAINQVVRQMVEATSVSMNQSRNSQLKEHGSWVVQSLDDCRRRMTILCHLKADGQIEAHESDGDFADKHFKQRLAGIAFDVAKCTKELVKTVEEASLKTNIEYLNATLSK